MSSASESIGILLAAGRYTKRAIESRMARSLHTRARRPSDEPEVTLSRRGMERLRGGHLWVYRSDLRAPADLRGGEVVRLVDERGWVAGKGFYRKKSQIAGRLPRRA